MSFGLVGTTATTGFGTPANQDFQVIIDGTVHNASTTDSSPPTYMQWYQSEMLDEGTHTVGIRDIDGTGLDYLLITPGSNTPLSTRILMVDDAYEGVLYRGAWSTVTDHTFSATSTSKLKFWSFQKGYHQTTTVGDSLTFSYTGKFAVGAS